MTLGVFKHFSFLQETGSSEFVIGTGLLFLVLSFSLDVLKGEVIKILHVFAVWEVQI